jgi:ribosomal-protein-serine acetyltransferase
MFTHRIADGIDLRLYEERHAQEVYDAVVANREYLARWLPWAERTKTVDDTLAFIRKSLEQFARGDGFQCGIWERDTYIGGCGFHWINRGGEFTEIGYWLAEKAQGRGIMTAACRALVDHAFDVWKLNKVEIRAASGNERSRGIPRRLGFTEEGTLRQIGKVGDAYHDLVVYGMLSREWTDLRARDGKR